MAHNLILILSMVLVACNIKQPGKIPLINSGSQTTSGSGSGNNSGTDTSDYTGIGLEIDPLASKAWHLKNTGQTGYSSNTGTGLAVVGEDIKAEEVYALGISGRGIKIAISDSGVDVNHSDLKANTLDGHHRNYLPDSPSEWHDSSPYPTGGNSHGTAVSGLASAVGWNNTGSRGVAPHSKFAAFKFVQDYGSATLSSLNARSVDQSIGDFDIFNYSYGYYACIFRKEASIINEAIENGVWTLRDGNGAIYIQSAGNEYIAKLSKCLGSAIPGEPDYYANTNHSSDLTTPYKIIVGATNAAGKRSSYSTPGSGIWISAPGGEYGTTSPAMLTTDLRDCNAGYSFLSGILNAFNGGRSVDNPNCDYTSYMNGTSSSAPVTSGVVALMLQANPSLTWRDVKHILAVTSNVIDNDVYPTILLHPNSETLPVGYNYDQKWVANSSGRMFSNFYGFGRVNALAAVTMAKNYTSSLGQYEMTVNPRDKTWIYTSGALSLPIPDNSAAGVSSQIMINHNYLVESVQVQLSITHPLPLDLAVHLVSPSGTESRLILAQNNIFAAAWPENKELLTNAFYGEESLGNWVIKTYDTKTGDIGTLTSWKIRINGHKVVSDGNSPAPVSAVTHQTIYGSGRLTPPVSFTASASMNIIRYEVSIGTSSGESDKVPWHSIKLATSFQLIELVLQNNQTYFINIRAIDSSENSSSVHSSSWKVQY